MALDARQDYGRGLYSTSASILGIGAYAHEDRCAPSHDMDECGT